MKTLAAVLVLVAAVSSFGAVVGFTGSPVTVAKGTASVDVPVTVTSDGGIGISAIDLVFASNTFGEAAQGVSNSAASGTLLFTFTPTVLATLPTVTAYGVSADGVHANTAWYETYTTTPNKSVASGIQVGDLVLGTANLALGTYTVVVNSDVDGTSGIGDVQGNLDSAYGTLTLNVIPEPCTMALLALGGLLVARRRQA